MIKDSQMLLEIDSSKNVLDFGCGDGGLLELFDLMDNLHNGIGIDLDEQLIEQANKNNENEKIRYLTSQNNVL